MTIISVVSTKGGVGKTVSSVHLGAALADAGYRTLLIDNDLQHGLTSYFNLDSPTCAMSHVLLGEASIEQAILEVRPNLDVLPASADMERAENHLAAKGGGELMLRRAFKQMKDARCGRPPWQFVLIDCPSGWGAVTRNALLASSSMIIPVNSEPAAVTNAAATEGAAREMAELHSHDLALCGVLLTRWRVTRSAQAVAEQCVEHWGKAVFETRIRQAEKVNELSIMGLVAGDVSRSAAGHVREDYEMLADEVIARCPTPKPRKSQKAMA